MNQKTGYKIAYILSVVAILLYGLMAAFLYYRQTLYPVTGTYESDLPFHISMAVDDHWYYSFTAYVYVLCSLFPFGNQLIAAFLAAMSVGTVLLTARLLKLLAGQEMQDHAFTGIRLGLALALNFAMAFYVPAANHAHYIGYQSGNLWHNSTYLVMRFFSVLAMILYVQTAEPFPEGLRPKQWICMTLCLIAATGVKPSFLVVFAPVLALFLLAWLIRQKQWKPVILLGLTVIPAVVVMFWQSIVLFGGDTGNGYVIRPFYVLSQRSENPKITLLLSVLFPFLVGLYHIRDFWKDRFYFGGLLLWAVGFGEVFLLAETGKRSQDANFLWGYSIALFFLFLVSLLRWLRDLKVVNAAPIRRAYLYLTGVLFLWHVCSGIWYFGILLTGATYFS